MLQSHSKVRQIRHAKTSCQNSKILCDTLYSMAHLHKKRTIRIKAHHCWIIRRSKHKANYDSSFNCTIHTGELDTAIKREARARAYENSGRNVCKNNRSKYGKSVYYKETAKGRNFIAFSLLQDEVIQTDHP